MMDRKFHDSFIVPQVENNIISNGREQSVTLLQIFSQSQISSLFFKGHQNSFMIRTKEIFERNLLYCRLLYFCVIL